MPSLGEFASGLRGAAADEKVPVHLVSGNEAADADSVVTALVYAYFLRHSGDRVDDTASAEEAEQPIAVVKCKREDMQLRSETVLLLRQCGVDASHLIFADDEEFPRLLERASKVTLMDHNACDGPFVALGDKVVEIVDHHKDLGQHAHVQGAQRNIAFCGEVATAASACTLVAERFLASCEGRNLLARDSGAVARALFGVILVDSINLNPAAKRVCDRDIEAASNLESLAPSPSQNELFAALDNAKFDATFWTSLQVDQCLRYDFKKFSAGGRSCGFSAVLCPLRALAEKDGWIDSLSEAAGSFDLFGVLSNSKVPEGGGVSRQLAIVSRDADLAAKAAHFLLKHGDGFLSLEELADVPGPPGMQSFDQKNVGASRKQVAPIVLAFFESLAA
eukprot:TRINITY_DN48568_c0_g1_i1.p1 TRINITY_DN48568_c0_g1~~TRINITY_DN48568_c0_g1_i1.p1  ORF type:complete len:393 (-),score=83.52 TRINITY_DN48568_c0_g1_i1:56-1234(-)